MSKSQILATEKNSKNLKKIINDVDENEVKNSKEGTCKKIIEDYFKKLVDSEEPYHYGEIKDFLKPINQFIKEKTQEEYQKLHGFSSEIASRSPYYQITIKVGEYDKNSLILTKEKYTYRSYMYFDPESVQNEIFAKVYSEIPYQAVI